jgi:hypothetical protein
MTQNSDREAKKLYQQPALKVYGTIETMTLAAGMLSNTNDNGKGNTKTS